MTRTVLLSFVLGACGSTSAPVQPSPSVAVVQPPPPQDDSARHDEIVTAHRKIEEEQQDALAATCDEPEPHDKHPRCLPSCYPTEPADPRAGKKLAGAVEITHIVCEQPGTDAFVIADEIDPGKLALRAVRGRLPATHKKGTWQATVESTLSAAQHPALVHGDAIVVSGSWRELVHPLTHERLRCVLISHYSSHYTKSMHRALDGCGGSGAIACEATGNAAARGINVVHYRLVEARALQKAGKASECQQAALEAIAVAHGLPRWRQYAKLNVDKWIDHAGYRTRFDGTLDEDTLFATAASMGSDAEAVYAACGGAAGAPTTAAQEQSFHACW